MREIMNPCLPVGGQPGFPHAPVDWTENTVRSLAKAEELELKDDHWEVIRALQSYFARHERMQSRELHDALDEKFHVQGGLKHVYELFPGGIIDQGCRFAGLEVSQGVIDPS